MCPVARIARDTERYAALLLTFSGLRAKVRHYAAGTEALCFIAPANGTENRHYVALRKCWKTSASATWIAQWLRSDIAAPIHPNPRLRAGGFFVCWTRWRSGRCAIRTSVIARVQTDSATITGVNQPSSANERSSISPCDR